MKKFLEIRTGQNNNYYTLWTVVSGGTVHAHDWYVQNLSINHDEALAKAQLIADERGCDLIDSSDDTESILYGNDVMRWGKNKGKRIHELEDGYLLWVCKYGPIIDRKTGEDILLIGNEFRDLAVMEAATRGLYVMYDGQLKPKSLVDYLEAKSKMYGHYFEDKEKVKNVPVIVLSVKGFEGSYGYTYILELVTDANTIITYKGSKCKFDNKLPDNVYFDQIVRKGDEFLLSGTVEHSEYRDQKCTYIKRPKFLLPQSVIDNALNTYSL